MKLAALAWVALCCVSSGRELQQEGAPVAAAASTPAILLRSPAEWPPDEPESWSHWTRTTPPPEEAAPLIERVGHNYVRGDLPAALAALFELLEQVPGYPPALHQAGVIYFRLRRYGDAAHAFERYLGVQPDRVADTRALGHCYYTLGRYEEAAAHYEEVLAVEPGSVEALRGYALARMRLGDELRALELLRTVVELEPGHANAYAWIAQILFDQARLDEALEAVLRARELAPYAPRPWFLASQIHYELGHEEAGSAAEGRFQLLSRIEAQTRGLEDRLLYDPRQPDVYDALVVLHGQAGDVGSVRHALLRWRMVAPEDVALCIHALDVLVAMGDARGAAEAAGALAEVGAHSAAAWRRLSAYYAATDQPLKQAEAQRRSVELRAGAGG